MFRENCSKLQAEHMAIYVGISLSPEQIKCYVHARESLDPVFRLKCDQELLAICLGPEQSKKLRGFYQNIFSEQN